MTLFERVSSFEDAHWLREYGDIPKYQIIVLKEMSESERVAWMRAAMTLLCRLLKDEAAAPNGANNRLAADAQAITKRPASASPR